MSIRTALHIRVFQDVLLRDLLGGTRLHINQAPPTGLFPRVVYQSISSDHLHHMLGPSGLVNALYQFSSMSVNDSEECFAVAEALRKQLDRFSGRINIPGKPSVDIDNIHIENQLDDAEVPSDGSEDVIHIIRQDYSVWYREPIPA